MKTAVSVLFVAALFVACCASAQTVKDTVVLDDVTVTGLKLSASSTGPFDSLARMQYGNASLGNMLAAFSGYGIRRYGPGGVATAAPRGYTPQQVSVKWNGVDITNPMLAQTDLSLLPVFFFDNAALRNVPNVTDNAPAGSVDLSESSAEKGLSVSSYNAWSSLHNLTNALRFKSGTDHWNASINLFNERDQNSFRFRNVAHADGTLVRQTHGESSGRGGSAGVRYVSGNNSIHGGGFVYRLQRNVPPTMLQQTGKDRQNDLSSAAFIRCEHVGKTSVKADASATLNAIGFYDGLADVDYDSHSAVYRSSLSVQRRMRLVDVQAGLQTAFITATVLPDVYKRTEWQHAAHLGLAKQFQPWRLKLEAEGSLRLRENELLPFNHSASVSFSPRHGVLVKLTNARLSRLPGLNDRYWKPGGNPDLKSELARRNNLSVSYGPSLKHAALLATCDVYYDRVDNWIQWVPSGAYWSPKNVKAVLLYGVTPTFVAQRQWNKRSASLTLRYNYNKAITRTSFAQNDASIGKQLTYVPLQTFHAHALVSTKKSSAFLLYNFFDRRFTASDNSSWLDPYMTLDAGLSHTVSSKQLSLTASGKVENVTGTDYQSIVWNPMPRRVYTVSISVEYNARSDQHSTNKTKSTP